MTGQDPYGPRHRRLHRPGLRDRPGRARTREKTWDINLNGKSIAELADHVLPALTAAMSLLKQQDPAEADNFRSTVIVAVEAAARTHQGRPSPTLVDMIRKITAALDAA
ncbi:hypothetical protein [Nonomuraea sp. NPDC049141]|uniref:hypothetical protein n=1 Tax=Nonomuraea sp. NPDC049141 TaxID=3155500 RepID=UPI0033DE02A4